MSECGSSEYVNSDELTILVEFDVMSSNVMSKIAKYFAWGNKLNSPIILPVHWVKLLVLV